MKKIACLGAVALLALVGCQSSEKKDTNMSVMSEKSGACCSEKATCTEKSADKGNMSVMSENKTCSEGAKTCSDKTAEKGNMSVMSEKKTCSGEKAATCPVTGKSGSGH